jgi:hypothetical protein
MIEEISTIYELQPFPWKRTKLEMIVEIIAKI